MDVAGMPRAKFEPAGAGSVCHRTIPSKILTVTELGDTCQGCALDRSSTLRTSTKQDGRLPAEPQVGAFLRRRTCR